MLFGEKENVFLSFYNINDELDIDNEEKIEVDFDKVKKFIAKGDENYHKTRFRIN